MENVNHDDALANFANPRTAHRLTNFTIKYLLDSQMSIGLDYLHSEVTYGVKDDKAKGNQIALSALYKF